jgi:hypothetical protein
MSTEPINKKVEIKKEFCFLCGKAVYTNEGKVADSKLFHAGCASKYWTKQAEEQRSKRSAQPIANVLEGITHPKPLHHVEAVHDTSAPLIDSDAKVKKNAHSLVMDQVQKVELKELKHVDTQDKAQPAIEKVKVKKSQRPKVLAEIQGFQGFAAKKAEYEQQVEAQTQVREDVFKSIANNEHKELHHVDEVHDTSKPHIEKEVQIKKNVHGQVFSAIQKVELKELKHVETADHSSPVIEKDVHVKKGARPALLNEIKTGPRDSKLDKLLDAYEWNVENSQKLDDSFRNREGADVVELAGVAQKTKSAYVQNVSESQKLDGINKNKEADIPDVTGLSQKVKEQYLKDVEVHNQEKEGTQKEKEGDKVVYKNLPPKKDLNEII